MIEHRNFEGFFKAISYGVAFCGLLSLYISGGVGILVCSLFLITALIAWFLENSRWQISEKIAVAIIFLVIPLFYVDWKYQIIGSVGEGFVAAGSLARLIVFLCAVKLLQKKSDRDWIFIYLISFFQVLLAAGLSISPLYLASIIIYLLFTVCAIITFEMRRASREMQTRVKVKSEKTRKVTGNISLKKLPLTAVILLTLITVLAVPLFFAFPRVGGAGLGTNKSEASRITGFSESVRLGEIGTLLQNDQTVMRVRLENADNLYNPRWRGVALDYFDNRGWSKSKNRNLQPFVKTERNVFIVDQTLRAADMVIQTVYLEPIQTPVLFALSRPVVVEGNFPLISKDAENSLNVGIIFGADRVIYRVRSDTFQPSAERLKKDNGAYLSNFARYLQLPQNLDKRISELATKISGNAATRYDKAKAIESYLQTQFGYTLEQRASGEQPLADFLFNIREGHCEYFATAMAVMLRTQGIATRVVNGFQRGEYNETADVFVVKQKDAHSWVEVYFPQEDAWIPFDPTPFAGQNAGNTNTTGGFLGIFNKYFEALETFWIQYFVAFDNQEQRSLFRSVRSGFQDYQAQTSVWLNDFQETLNGWWKEACGDRGFEQSAIAIGYGFAYLAGALFGIFLLVWVYRKIVRLAFWQKLHFWLKNKKETSIIEFYERMQRALAVKGFTREPHQTPLEFAFALNMPEAVKITEKYNLVRFGEKNLSNEEAEEIEKWLKSLEMEN
jgi:protein-glutamine gamma-glutamyltransferase